MLNYELKGDILEVTETTMSFLETTRQVVEYNIKTWESRVNQDPFRPMTQSSVEWVKKYYLPKVKGV